MNLTTEKLREYIKSMVKANTDITEDDDYIYFTTRDLLNGIVLANLGYTVDFKIAADGFIIRATKPDWFDKKNIMDYLNICSDVHNIEETNTHIYFNTDDMDTIFGVGVLGYRCVYQENPATGMYRVSVFKK